MRGWQSPAVSTISFNSLQTGKGISMCPSLGVENERIKFQFPSNGKGYLNENPPSPVCGRCQRFNSLQTGKGISILL